MPFFQDFPGHVSIHKHELHEVKNVHIQKPVISVSALQQRSGNSIPEIVLLLYLTV